MKDVNEIAEYYMYCKVRFLIAFVVRHADYIRIDADQFFIDVFQNLEMKSSNERMRKIYDKISYRFLLGVFK